MNDGLKSLLIFIMGAGVGALITYQLLNDKYEAIAQEEIESVKEVFGRGTIEDRDEDRNDHTIEMPNMEEKSRYKKLVKKYTPYNMVKEGGEEKVSHDYLLKEVHNSESIYVISVDSFGDEYKEYDKLSISYYEDDDTLVDEKDDVIQDVQGTIGEALLCFGDQSDDPDVVYVRNERLGIDYEIILVHNSYQVAVLGIKISDDRGVAINHTNRAMRRRLNEDS